MWFAAKASKNYVQAKWKNKDKDVTRKQSFETFMVHVLMFACWTVTVIHMSSDTSHFHRLPFATVLITFFEVSPVNAELWRMYLDVKAAWNPTWPFTLRSPCKTSDIWNIMKWHKSELKRSDSMRFVLFTLSWLKQIWVTWAKNIRFGPHLPAVWSCERSLILA